MHFLVTKDKPPLYVGIAAVSLMILTGLTLAVMAVALTVIIPIFVVLSPILLPAVITWSFLATGFLASGSLGASGITLIVWLYKKEEHFRYTLHVRGVRSEGANKPAGGGKLPGTFKLSEADKPPGGHEQAEETKPPRGEKPSEKDKPLGKNKPPEGGEKPSEKDKPRGKNKPPEEDKPVGVKQASIPEISKVLLVELNPISPKYCGPGTSAKRSHQIRFTKDPTKVRSIFMKEYQKVPRVGAFAFKHFTSRDKK